MKMIITMISSGVKRGGRKKTVSPYILLQSTGIGREKSEKLNERGN